jgi:fumarylacetoacetate (FAA) hydrolase
MRLATRPNGLPDGELMIVSSDGAMALAAGPDWPNLLTAIEQWERAEPALRSLSQQLDAGAGEPLTALALHAPLCRDPGSGSTARRLPPTAS